MFRIFSNVSCCEDEQYIRDIKLPHFFSSFSDKESVCRLIQFLKSRPNEQDVVKRQNFFNEVLFDESMLSFFKCMQSGYHFLKKEATDCASHQNNEIATFFLLKTYANVVSEIYTTARTLSPQSTLMTELVQGWVDLVQSVAFLQLQKQLAEIDQLLSQLKKSRLCMQLRNARILSCDFLPNELEETSPCRVTDVLSNFLDETGIEISNPPVPKSIGGNNRYYAYISVLYEKEPVLRTLLLKLKQCNGPAIQSIQRATITDVSTVLDIYATLHYLRNKDIDISFPQVSEYGSLSLYGMKDITLLTQKSDIVANECVLAEDEHNIFLFGANGGGKTSYIRAVGICALFARCGLFIPAKAGKVPMFHQFFSFFATDETTSLKDGRFQEEQSEILKMMQNGGMHNLLLFNETYSDTDEPNAVSQLEKLALFNLDQNNTAFYVTHFHSIVQNRSYAQVILSCLPDEFGNNTHQFKRTENSYSTVYSILDKYNLTKEKLNAMEKSV